MTKKLVDYPYKFRIKPTKEKGLFQAFGKVQKPWEPKTADFAIRNQVLSVKQKAARRVSRKEKLPTKRGSSSRLWE